MTKEEDLCSGLAQSKSGPQSNHNAVAGPEAGSSCQTPIQPYSIGEGVKKNPPQQMSETD